MGRAIAMAKVDTIWHIQGITRSWCAGMERGEKGDKVRRVQVGRTDHEGPVGHWNHQRVWPGAAWPVSRWCKIRQATKGREDYREQGWIHRNWNSAYGRSWPLIGPLWGKETCKQIIKTWQSNGTNRSHWFWLSTITVIYHSLNMCLMFITHCMIYYSKGPYKAGGIIHRSAVCNCHPISQHPQLSTA